MKKTLTMRLLAMLMCVAMLATVTPVFAAAETTITEIAITDADVTPYGGVLAEDCLNYTLPEDCHFTVDNHYWYDEESGDHLPGDALSFVKDREYSECWWLEADTGYTFDENATVTINGSTAVVDTSYTKWQSETEFSVWTLPTMAQDAPALESGINLLVGKTWVTGANAADVLGDGTVSYDDETKTLTLNNANITDYVYVTDAWAYCSI